MPSLFVTAAGELKLAGFELAASLSEQDALLCDYSRFMRDCNFRDWPPEVSSFSGCASWAKIRSFPPWAVDSYMLAAALKSIFGEKHNQIPAELATYCQAAITSDAHTRPNPSIMLESSRLFKTKLVVISERLDSFAAMDLKSRESFFSLVGSHLDSLPVIFIKYKLIPALTSLPDLQSRIGLEGINIIMKCAVHLSTEEFRQSLFSVLALLFSNPDRAVRIVLLESLPQILEKLDAKFVQESIYPQMISGFTDALPALREHTLKASLLIAPKMTSRQLNNELLRFFARLQSDEQPGIRVNTTVCLGKIAPQLEESTRQKVLGVAFVKALHDPFAPARSAALMTISATVDFLTIDEISRRVLPSIVPLLVDPERSIRDAAFKTSRQLMGKLESHSAQMVL